MDFSKSQLTRVLQPLLARQAAGAAAAGSRTSFILTATPRESVVYEVFDTLP